MMMSTSLAAMMGVLAMSGAAMAGGDPAPLKALLITGQNNHNWPYTSRVHNDTLEATGRFEVDIADQPQSWLKDPQRLKPYSVFVLDYNGPRWGEPMETNFLNAVREGAGVVIIHASNNAFVGWTDYEKLCGFMWIDGKTSHGDFHHFDVTYLKPDHPILKDLPGMKSHPDELYHNLINTQGSTFDLLADAYSSPESRGSGKKEPMAMTLAYGKGRVFHTPLGHVWKGADNQKASIHDPQFKLLLARGTEWAATGSVTIGTDITDTRRHNLLSAEEQSAGWKLLFDGNSVDAWRGFKMETFPKGWLVKGGSLVRDPSAGQNVGDIVTKEEFGDFEFSIDWKVNKAGNSGVMYRCDEKHKYPWETGPEMQILDDSGHADGKKDKTRAGTLYDLIPCAYDVCRPAGEWNQARIVCRGTRIEHWLNGFRVVEVDTATDAYKSAKEASKWTRYPDHNTLLRGRIALQDHGDEVWFRNMKVRELK
jgi:type 1 glutamine amidotransferase